MNIQSLKQQLTGRVITPDDDVFDKARTVFYGGIDCKPAAIIRVADAKDVTRAIAFARDNGLPLAVRSGGHSVAGYSTCDGGIVIDVHDMKKIDINTADKTVWAQTGLTARELTDALDTQNVVLGFGDTGSVGIGGITLGGGIGYLVRKYGMTIDNLLTAEVVTADGKVLIADETHHLDLFWAIRGGGGNFGVVTRFQYRLHELKRVYGGILLLPATAETITGCITLSQKAPNELSAIFNIMPAPPMPMVPKEAHGKLCIMAMMLYAGDPKQGEEVIAPIRALAPAIADMVKPIRYKEMFFPDDASYHPLAVSQTMMVDHVHQSSAQHIIRQLESLKEAPMRVVQLRVLGGAMATVPSENTAFAHRTSTMMVNIAAFYTTDQEKKLRSRWVADTARHLFQGDTGVYIGFLGKEGERAIDAAYPKKTMERLVKVKRMYDPTNVFRFNLNIKP